MLEDCMYCEICRQSDHVRYCPSYHKIIILNLPSNTLASEIVTSFFLDAYRNPLTLSVWERRPTLAATPPAGSTISSPAWGWNSQEQ